MTTPAHTVPCLRNERIAQDIFEFTLEKPAGMTFKPGQFVLFDTPLIENPEETEPRAFSIASAPNEPELLFVAKLIEGGRASRWISEMLKTGDSVGFQGPLGLFTLDETTDKDYLFICTSTGNAPFRSMILDTLHRHDGRRMDLVYGVRSEEDLFWKEELEKLANAHSNFHLHISLSQPSQNWQGHTGRVQTLVEEVVTDFSTKNIYVCGNPAMTSDIKKHCLEQWGVEKKDLHVEGYI